MDDSNISNTTVYAMPIGLEQLHDDWLMIFCADHNRPILRGQKHYYSDRPIGLTQYADMPITLYTERPIS